MRRIYRLGIISLLLVCCIVFLLWKAFSWRNPGLNWEGSKRNIHHCIHDSKYDSASFDSMNHQFDVFYVKNANTECINPYFPNIQIKTKDKHNAWIQVIYTDSLDPKWRAFIDVTNPSDIYPFYTFEQDLYDSPLWEYGLFFKPLSYWKAHAYALDIDRKAKTFRLIGGVQWGFELSYYKLRPQMILPTPLTLKDWEKDWLLYKDKKELQGFRQIEP